MGGESIEKSQNQKSQSKYREDKRGRDNEWQMIGEEKKDVDGGLFCSRSGFIIPLSKHKRFQ
jgi:hypothetical protein